MLVSMILVLDWQVGHLSSENQRLVSLIDSQHCEVYSPHNRVLPKWHKSDTSGKFVPNRHQGVSKSFSKNTSSENELTTLFRSLSSRHALKERVVTAQGKQGNQVIWMFIFSDRGNTGNLPKHIKTRKSSCVNARGIPRRIKYSICYLRWVCLCQGYPPPARSDRGVSEVGYHPPARSDRGVVTRGGVPPVRVPLAGAPPTQVQWGAGPGCDTLPRLDLAGVPLLGVYRQTRVKT